MNFMFPVPDASVPAVEICSDKSDAGMTEEEKEKERERKRKRERERERTKLIFRYKELPGEFCILTFFCQGDAIVLKEDDLQPVGNDRVMVDHWAQSNGDREVQVSFA